MVAPPEVVPCTTEKQTNGGSGEVRSNLVVVESGRKLQPKEFKKIAGAQIHGTPVFHGDCLARPLCDRQLVHSHSPSRPEASDKAENEQSGTVDSAMPGAICKQHVFASMGCALEACGTRWAVNLPPPGRLCHLGQRQRADHWHRCPQRSKFLTPRQFWDRFAEAPR